MRENKRGNSNDKRIHIKTKNTKKTSPAPHSRFHIVSLLSIVYCLLCVIIMDTGPLRYPSCYPRAPKACKPVALQFFSCLNENSAKATPSDTDAANRGLQACAEQMTVYVKCMEKLEKEVPPKRFRVSFFILSWCSSAHIRIQVHEEYRANVSS